MGDLRVVFAGGALSCALILTSAVPATAQVDSRVIGASGQEFADGFSHFTNATNVSGFSGPSVSPNGRVFFTTDVSVSAPSAGCGRGLFVDNGAQTTALLGCPELGSQRLIPSTVDFPGTVRIRATGRNSVLLVASVDGVDGLWDIDVDESEAVLVQGEGVGGIINVGLGRFADDDRRAFWGDRNGNVYFSGLAELSNQLYRYDGSSVTSILATGQPAPGLAGAVDDIRFVDMDDSGALVAAIDIELDGGGIVPAILRYTVAGWTPLATFGDGLQGIVGPKHLGRGGHLVFEADYSNGERVDPTWLRLSPDGVLEPLATVFQPPPGETDPIARASRVHAAPDGTAVLSTSILGNNAILIAPPDGAIAVAYREGESALGTSTFEQALGFESDTEGRLYISASVDDGRIVARTPLNASSAGDTLFSEAFTYEVDGEERDVESLFFGWGGRFASTDGSVVCSRIDLDAPTNVGLVCTGAGSTGGDLSISAEVQAARLAAASFISDDDVELSYDFIVDLDIAASPGTWAVDIEMTSNQSFGTPRIVNRVGGAREDACSVAGDRLSIRCGDVSTDDGFELQLQIYYPVTGTQSYDLSLAVSGQVSDGDEVAELNLEPTTAAFTGFDASVRARNDGSCAFDFTVAETDELVEVFTRTTLSEYPGGAELVDARFLRFAPPTPAFAVQVVGETGVREFAFVTAGESVGDVIACDAAVDTGDKCWTEISRFDPDPSDNAAIVRDNDPCLSPIDASSGGGGGCLSVAPSGVSAWPWFLALALFWARLRRRGN